MSIIYDIKQIISLNSNTAVLTWSIWAHILAAERAVGGYLDNCKDTPSVASSQRWTPPLSTPPAISSAVRQRLSSPARRHWHFRASRVAAKWLQIAGLLWQGVLRLGHTFP